MKRTFLIAVIVGLITGVVVGVLLHTVPTIDDLIPDHLNSLIIGGLAGGLSALFITKNRSS